MALYIGIGKKQQKSMWRQTVSLKIRKETYKQEKKNAEELLKRAQRARHHKNKTGSPGEKES